MRHELYSVQDRVAELYGPVFQAVNVGVARRMVMRMMAEVAKYDRDSYRLIHIGYFDDVLGRVESFENPSVVELEFPRLDEIKGREFDFGEVKNG